MARSENQKLKLLHLIRIFREHTDENHALTLAEIIAYLEAEDIVVERKTLYADFELLRDFGIEISCYKLGRNSYYSLIEREFDLPEIKMLVDAVWSSKFITQSKSRDLVKKLGGQLSRYDAQSLKRQVYVSDRVKSMNEKIYYNVDAIHEAIASDSRISFVYLEWNSNKELVPRKNGNKEDISPWMLLWENATYYLVAFDPSKKELRHYRVDKMDRIRIDEGSSRDGGELFRAKGMDNYSQKRFQMYNGEPETITLECRESLLGTLIDYFGTEVTIRPSHDGYYEVRVQAAPTELFMGWIMGLGEGVKIAKPAYVVDKMNTWLQSGLRRHGTRSIRNVIFDLGSVLVDFRYLAYMKELGFSEELCDFFVKNIILGDVWLKMDSGSYTVKEALEEWIRRHPQMEEALRIFFRDPTGLVAPYPDTQEWLRWCKTQGYRVFLLTNYPGDIFELHAKKVFTFLPDVDGYVVSAQERITKPSEDIYKTLLQRYDLEASECVFLDDREDNVSAAEGLGIHGILVDNRAKAWQELRDFLQANS